MYDCLKRTNSAYVIKVREEILALFESHQQPPPVLMCDLLDEVIIELASREYQQVEMFGKIDPGDRKPLNALL